MCLHTNTKKTNVIDRDDLTDLLIEVSSLMGMI